MGCTYSSDVQTLAASRGHERHVRCAKWLLVCGEREHSCVMDSHDEDGRAGIDAGLVKRLIAAQFPEWAGLPVVPVAFDGWDNRTYRLGESMTVRLPTAAGYVPAVAKENEWLPRLAPSLPVPVPPVLAMEPPVRDIRSHGR